MEYFIELTFFFQSANQWNGYQMIVLCSREPLVLINIFVDQIQHSRSASEAALTEGWTRYRKPTLHMYTYMYIYPVYQLSKTSAPSTFVGAQYQNQIYSMREPPTSIKSSTVVNND